MLKFLGRGSGFSDNHNSSFFVYNNELIMIDCSIMAFIRLKNEGITSFTEGKDVEKITILITHTHSDHIGGIPMLIHYSYFVWKLPVTVLTATDEVKADMDYYLTRLDGCDKSAFTIESLETYDKLEWLRDIIPTKHVEPLDGKCFGYRLSIDGKSVVYTGDSRTIKTYLPYIENDSYLFTECSAFKTEVHTPIEEVVKLKDYFKEKNVKVYLMHLDDTEKIAEAVKETDYEFAPLA